jgi:hypothetical protein
MLIQDLTCMAHRHPSSPRNPTPGIIPLDSTRVGTRAAVRMRAHAWHAREAGHPVLSTRVSYCTDDDARGGAMATWLRCCS